MILPPAPRPQLRLTRRGRLVRSGLVLLLGVLLVLTLVAVARALAGGPGAPGADASSPAVTAGDSGAEGPSDGGGAAEGLTPEADGAPETDGDGPLAEGEMVHTGTVGEGTWTFAQPTSVTAAADGTTVHTYAVRVENGIEVSAEQASTEIAQVLTDPRGWQELEGVSFQQVATAEEAEFTISLGSPPTVDALCLPAKTGGTWSCRIGPDVALNSDRWLHATPTFDDLAEYRAYMVNHEVGHFLGHNHAQCGAAEAPAPVMLQQSMDLKGCTPNAWPATSAIG